MRFLYLTRKTVKKGCYSIMHKRYIIEFRMEYEVGTNKPWWPVETNAAKKEFGFGKGNGPFLIFNSAQEAVTYAGDYFPVEFGFNGPTTCIYIRVNTIEDLSAYMKQHLWPKR